jgi:hypothetical protein
MKESSCHNPKMAAYYREVRQLEDKFDGLKLNHILRWLNEAADTLAKAPFGQEMVPTGVFTSDKYKPRNAPRSNPSVQPSRCVGAQGLAS